MKAIPRLPATSWQQWLDKGMVTFDVTDGPLPPREEGELSSSGVSGQSASDEVQKRDDYEGPQQLNPIHSPARSVNRSPIGSIHSHVHQDQTMDLKYRQCLQRPGDNMRSNVYSMRSKSRS